MTDKTGQYLPGHDDWALAFQVWRTAANSAAYLIPHVKPNMHILDVGCGPGTITIDFARLVSEGKVIGIDTSQDVLEKAQDTAKGHQIKNIEFQAGDVLALKFPDNTFDVVHAHQVLQYVADPVLALSEMRRVAKPGGVVAVREGDYLGSIIYPESPEIGYFWRDLYPRLMLTTGGEPAAARKLQSWARKAGFEKSRIKFTSSTWCFNTTEDITWWGNSWAELTLTPALIKAAEDSGLGTRKELEGVFQAWKDWIKEEDAWFNAVHAEIIYSV